MKTDELKKEKSNQVTVYWLRSGVKMKIALQRLWKDHALLKRHQYKEGNESNFLYYFGSPAFKAIFSVNAKWKFFEHIRTETRYLFVLTCQIPINAHSVYSARPIEVVQRCCAFPKKNLFFVSQARTIHLPSVLLYSTLMFSY